MYFFLSTFYSGDSLEPLRTHAIKFSHLSDALWAMRDIVSKVDPPIDLLEFSLYDFEITYRDKWGNAPKFDKNTQV